MTAHRITGAASRFASTQSQSSETCRSMCAYPSPSSLCPCSVHRTARCGLAQAKSLLERGAVRNWVGSAPSRKSHLLVVASSTLLQAQGWQPTRSVGIEQGEILLLCCVAYRSKPILQRAERITSKFPLATDLLLPFVEATAFLVVSWAAAAFAVRRCLLFQQCADPGSPCRVRAQPGSFADAPCV